MSISDLQCLQNTMITDRDWDGKARYCSLVTVFDWGSRPVVEVSQWRARHFSVGVHAWLKIIVKCSRPSHYYVQQWLTWCRIARILYSKFISHDKTQPITSLSHYDFTIQGNRVKQRQFSFKTWILLWVISLMDDCAWRWSNHSYCHIDSARSLWIFNRRMRFTRQSTA